MSSPSVRMGTDIGGSFTGVLLEIGDALNALDRAEVARDVYGLGQGRDRPGRGRGQERGAADISAPGRTTAAA